MRYVLETPRQRFMVLELFWGRLPEGAPDLPADAEFAGFPIVPVSGARQLTALVYQTIDAIRIHVDPAVSRLEILEVAVLELAPDWIP
jgi:hypothetical protein